MMGEEGDACYFLFQFFRCPGRELCLQTKRGEKQKLFDFSPLAGFLFRKETISYPILT
jgi:hypothetical protein